MARWLRQGATAGVAAAVLSGAPSTLDALVHRRSPLEAARAAGVILGRPSLARGLAAHAVISLGWGVVLTAVLPRRHAPAWGALAGAGIYVLDMEVIGRRWPAIRALPRLPQLADHLAFGIVLGWVRAAAE
jgi:hypothetical protein